MTVVADVLIGIVALLHVYFAVLEMLLWTRPAGRRAFGLERDFAQATKSLAANQGLYNGFLVAGLLWGLLRNRESVQLFFLGCVVVAGVFGAATVSRRILVVQAVPAVLAIAAVLLAH
jgi:putative membrane protein